jgi:hypothetical protein
MNTITALVERNVHLYQLHDTLWQSEVASIRKAILKAPEAPKKAEAEMQRVGQPLRPADNV